MQTWLTGFGRIGVNDHTRVTQVSNPVASPILLAGSIDRELVKQEPQAWRCIGLALFRFDIQAAGCACWTVRAVVR